MSGTIGMAIARFRQPSLDPPPPIPTDGLFAQYDFGQASSGIVLNAAGGGFDLDVTGAAVGSKGGVNDVLLVDGSSEVSYFGAVPDCYAVGVSVYVTGGISNGNTQHLLGLRQSNPQAYFVIGDNSGYATSETITFGDGEGPYGRTYTRDTWPEGWYRIIFTWDASISRWRIYVNGSEPSIYSGSSSGHAGPATSSNNTIQFAKYISVFGWTLSGALRRSALYGAPLDAGNVALLDGWL